MKTKRYSVFVREADYTGTTHVSSHDAESIEAAKAAAIAEVLKDWNDAAEPYYTEEDLVVIGVIAGDVEILEWDDGE